MPKKCSIFNCRTNYRPTIADRSSSCANCNPDDCKCIKFNCVCKSLSCPCNCKVCKPSVFRFPNDPIERENWIRACPNQFGDQKDIVICEWHWPENYETVTPTKSSHLCCRLPKNPPSVFSVPPSCSRQSFSKKRSSRALSDSRNDYDELDLFNEQDKFTDFDSLIAFCKTSVSNMKNIVDDEYICLFDGPLQKMNASVTIQKDFSFTLSVRGVDVPNKLNIQFLLRKSQLEEVIRFVLQKHAMLDEKVTAFIDRQNQLIVTDKYGRRYNADDISFALKIISISRSAYVKLRSFLPLPSIRSLQKVFSSSSFVPFEAIFDELSPMQRYVHLNIDEVYVKPSLRFTGGQIFGYACDNQNVLARTVLVIYANCDFAGPKFVAALKPVYRLTAEFQLAAVESVIRRVNACGGTVTSCTFDGNSVNTRMVSMVPGIDDGMSKTSHFGAPIFWLNDPVHLIKCIRNNFLQAKILEFVSPSETRVRQAVWNDLVDIQSKEESASKSLRASRLTKLSVAPPPISRQRVDLALKVFCHETSAALQMNGKCDTAAFIDLVTNFFAIMNTRNPDIGTHLSDPFRKPITTTSSENLVFLRDFRLMIGNMKPPRARRCQSDKTLTMETACATERSLNGYIQLCEYLLSCDFSYVLLGRYTNDPVEKLFGKWRQSAGGNYFISVSEIHHSERIQWSKIATTYLGRTSDKMSSLHSCELCHAEQDGEFNIPQNEMEPHLVATCGYVAGYLCSQFPSLPSQDRDTNSNYSALISLLDRGGLNLRLSSILEIPLFHLF